MINHTYIYLNQHTDVYTVYIYTASIYGCTYIYMLIYTYEDLSIHSCTHIWSYHTQHSDVSWREQDRNNVAHPQMHHSGDFFSGTNFILFSGYITMNLGIPPFVANCWLWVFPELSIILHFSVVRFPKSGMDSKDLLQSHFCMIQVHPGLSRY